MMKLENPILNRSNHSYVGIFDGFYLLALV